MTANEKQSFRSGTGSTYGVVGEEPSLITRILVAKCMCLNDNRGYSGWVAHKDSRHCEPRLCNIMIHQQAKCVLPLTLQNMLCTLHPETPLLLVKISCTSSLTVHCRCTPTPPLTLDSGYRARLHKRLWLYAETPEQRDTITTIPGRVNG